MQFEFIKQNGKSFVAGRPGVRILNDVADASTLIETCFSHHSKRLLLYAENLTTDFFDLSSLEAGSILQKLRTYGIRLAVLCGQTQEFSKRFQELMSEEKKNFYFNVFQDREEAEAWLLHDED